MRYTVLCGEKLDIIIGKHHGSAASGIITMTIVEVVLSLKVLGASALVLV